MAKVFGQLQLPRFFAEQMLECQIESYLSQKMCPSLIRKSIELYTTGLEYYQSIRSSKFLYFKKKMEDLVRNPTIIMQMNSKEAKEQDHKEPLQSQIQLTNEQEQRRIELLQIRQKCERLHNEIITNTTGITSEKIRAILNQNEIKAYETKQIIKGQISQQQKKLKQKIQQRKMKKQFKKTIVSIGNWGDKSTQDSTSVPEEEFDQIDRTVTDFEEMVILQIEQQNSENIAN